MCQIISSWPTSPSEVGWQLQISHQISIHRAPDGFITSANKHTPEMPPTKCRGLKGGLARLIRAEPENSRMSRPAVGLGSTRVQRRPKASLPLGSCPSVDIPSCRPSPPAHHAGGVMKAPNLPQVEGLPVPTMRSASGPTRKASRPPTTDRQAEHTSTLSSDCACGSCAGTGERKTQLSL